MWQFFLLCHISQFQTITNNHMNDADQYFQKTIMFKNLHNATCQILIDE